jgi:hypothetical protein
MCEGWECYRKAEKLMTRGAVRGWIVVYKNKVCNGIIGYIEVGRVVCASVRSSRPIRFMSVR